MEMEELSSRIQECKKCPIGNSTENTFDEKLNGKVCGYGKSGSVCFLGIAPSCIRRGLKAFTDSELGALMTQFLKTIDINRDDVFFSNIIKCIVNPREKVFTSKGWKEIQKIKIGDLVLTHKGRFRKVVKIFNEKYKDNKFVRITFEACNQYYKYQTIGKIDTIMVTPEHPFLTQNGFKCAKDLTTKDELKVLASKCIVCGKLMRQNIKSKYSFCNKSCENSYIMKKLYKNGTLNKFKILNAAHIKNKELVKNGQHIFQTADRTGLNHPWYKMSIEKRAIFHKKLSKLSKQRIKDMKVRGINLPKLGTVALNNYYKTHARNSGNNFKIGFNTDTKIELMLCAALSAANIEYKTHIKIGKYWPDIVINKIVVECDGDYWHSLPNVKIKDIQKTQFYEQQGFKVLHFTEKQIKNNLQTCVDEIQRLLFNDRHEYNLLFTKLIKVENIISNRVRRKYNLSVQDDESFIVKNVVVHNCSTPENRKPTGQETNNCYSWLIEELKIAKPKLLVVMGADAAHIFDMKIGDTKWILLDGRNVMTYAMYHPAACTRGSISYFQFQECFTKIDELLKRFT